MVARAGRWIDTSKNNNNEQKKRTITQKAFIKTHVAIHLPICVLTTGWVFFYYFIFIDGLDSVTKYFA